MLLLEIIQDTLLQELKHISLQQLVQNDLVADRIHQVVLKEVVAIKVVQDHPTTIVLSVEVAPLAQEALEVIAEVVEVRLDLLVQLEVALVEIKIT